jgi:hypothetical protein
MPDLSIGLIDHLIDKFAGTQNPSIALFINAAGGFFELRETLKPYGANNDLAYGNMFLWDQ